MTAIETSPLRGLRLSRSIGLRALARAVPMDKAVLSKLERGLFSTINGNYAAGLARELGYPIDVVIQAFNATRTQYLASHPNVSPIRHAKSRRPAAIA